MVVFEWVGVAGCPTHPRISNEWERRALTSRSIDHEESALISACRFHVSCARDPDHGVAGADQSQTGSAAALVSGQCDTSVVLESKHLGSESRQQYGVEAKAGRARWGGQDVAVFWENLGHTVNQYWNADMPVARRLKFHAWENCMKVLRSSLLFFLLAFAAVAAFAQSELAPIAASAVWQPPSDFLAQARAACDKVSPSQKFADCVINQMPKAGASADAVNFTRELFKQTGGEVGVYIAERHFLEGRDAE